MMNIVFDLGNVLLEGSSSEILNHIDINDDEYNELLKFFEYNEQLDLGNMTLEDHFNSIIIPDYLKSKYRDYLLHYYEYRRINFNLVRLINYLHDNNYHIYVISDNNINASKYYKKNLLFKNIEGWIFSCDYQTIKKDGKLFKLFLDKFHLDAKDCYFIDDNKINLDVANKMGFITFKYQDNFDELIKDMHDNNITIS